jgi:hypothetical protein
MLNFLLRQKNRNLELSKLDITRDIEADPFSLGFDKYQISYYENNLAFYTWKDNGQYCIISLTERNVFNRPIYYTRSDNASYTIPSQYKISYFAGHYIVCEDGTILDTLDNNRVVMEQNVGYRNIIDPLDPESKIYTDICHPITFSISVEDINGKDSLKNLDITLEQRKKYYFPGNVNLCPLGCKYFGIDKDTISSVCTCNEEYFNNILSEDFIENEEYINFNFDKKDFYDSNNDIYFSLNTLKCLKLPFTSIGFKNNYGSIIIIILALVI